MARTNIVIDDRLIREARKLTGLKTKRELVNRALELLVRMEARKGILRYRGSGIWKGDLKASRRNRVWSLVILVDSSVWIDFFSASPRAAGLELARLIEDAAPLALTGIVMTEVLQGLTRDFDRIERYLSMWDLLEPSGLSTYRQAAALFRLCRSKGISPTTVDTLIAAIALDHGATLFTLDRDFSLIARVMNLPLYELP
jgi:predicted nucleic acid-binding protein/Arc/MetJ family transcription regulator